MAVVMNFDISVGMKVISDSANKTLLRRVAYYASWILKFQVTSHMKSLQSYAQNANVYKRHQFN